jgi:hypothetical protein
MLTEAERTQGPLVLAIGLAVLSVELRLRGETDERVRSGLCKLADAYSERSGNLLGDFVRNGALAGSVPDFEC